MQGGSCFICVAVASNGDPSSRKRMCAGAEEITFASDVFIFSCLYCAVGPAQSCSREAGENCGTDGCRAGKA